MEPAQSRGAERRGAPVLPEVYRGRRTVAAIRMMVECRSDGSSYQLRIGDHFFRIDGSAGSVRLLGQRGGGPGAVDPSVAAPARILGLATQRIFCLHASSVRSPRGVLAFVGRSGKGKSTLAAHLSAGGGDGWEVVSDDILPLDFLSRPPVVRSLVGLDRYGRERDPLPLAAVYVLRNSKREDVTISSLTPAQACVTLIRHAVATRLFDARLKTSHFEACVSGSLQVPVRTLCYPRRLSVLDEVRKKLEAEL